jgi:hypothetical protein
MNFDKLTEIIELHNKWLDSKSDGVRADLRGVDLRGVDLRGGNLIAADLSGANLSGGNLSGVNLRNANLNGIDLSGASLWYIDLSAADLSDANLSDADLSDADLWRANLSNANLRDANLRDADLKSADLRNANLSGVDLRYANLSGAYLRDANFEQTKLPGFQIPQEGSLIVWKKLKDDCIAKLKIPNKSKRTASLVGRKCRAEFVKVIEIYHASGVKLDTGISCYDSTIKYNIGEITYPDSYDPDIRVECTHGIQFFLTREEAEVYNT